MTSLADAMEPRLLRSFVTVAEELHFGRAAVRLHMTQPPLSMQIKRLEDHLGVRLFERSRRHVALTEAGSFLLTRARRLLDDAERACSEAARIARGEAGALAIGYTPTATYEVLPPLLHAYRRHAPGVRLELVEMRSALQIEALRTGRIEVGFACGPVDGEGLVERVLARERLVAVISKGHPLADRKRIRMRDLDGQPFVVVRPDVEPAWAQACSRALVRAGVRVEITQETDTKIAMLGLVAAGVGLSLVSASMMQLARHGVVFREVTDLRVRMPLVALFGAAPSARATALLRLATQQRLHSLETSLHDGSAAVGEPAGSVK